MSGTDHIIFTTFALDCEDQKSLESGRRILCQILKDAFSMKFSSESTDAHDIFMKEHTTRNYDDSKPPGKTLFLLNIPPYATEESIIKMFGIGDSVISVELHQNLSTVHPHNCGFKVGYIVFRRREDLLKVLKQSSTFVLSDEENSVKTGLHKWISNYNYLVVDTKHLVEDTNVFINNYDKEQEAQKLQNKNQVDDEGWTVVTKKGRNPGISRKESVENNIGDKLNKGSKNKELKNFYTFQIRESKMKNLANLRKNYEEAKKKVIAMKTARRFKPY